MENSTSAIIAAPHGFNLTQLAEPISWFGDLVAFNNPLTLDNNLHSEPIGKAQGFYLYDSKIPYSAWHGFSFVLNTTDYKGSIDMVGANADILGQIVRNLSIVGGTGDFFMHRGIASLMSDDIQGEAYYRLKFDLKFYECW
ncbi:Plant disease resistance response protein [Corchorus olitorius]|uniref:Dirigent protein n=1 Tax=Corchorus olitorius TaxID=93759 RepID=A0A1R3IR96_9ROSI|nr:Plant disease resistance response protein [Corchorus olitorius]